MIEGVMFGCRTLWRDDPAMNKTKTEPIKTEVGMDLYLFSVFVPLERGDDSSTAWRKVHLAWAAECDRYGFHQKAERYRKKAEKPE